MVKPTILLLLSGGKDSPHALQLLQKDGWQIYALCIDGIQGKEKIGAQIAAAKYQIPLEVATIRSFDEETWNPLKLIYRDIAMGLIAIKKAKAVGASAIATGVKKSDIQNPKLWWLYPFLLLGTFVFRLCGLRLLHPAWEWDGKTK